MTDTSFLDSPWVKGIIGAGAGYLATQADKDARANQQQLGYQGGIPDFTGIRQAVPSTFDAERRPGSGGQRYFTDTQYIDKADQPAVDAATARATEQGLGLAGINAGNPASSYTPISSATTLSDPTAGRPPLERTLQTITHWQQCSSLTL